MQVETYKEFRDFRKKNKKLPLRKGKEEGGCLYLINWITSLACTDDEEIDTDMDVDENGDQVEDEGKLVMGFKLITS